jgi:hypothetical protein
MKRLLLAVLFGVIVVFGAIVVSAAILVVLAAWAPPRLGTDHLVTWLFLLAVLAALALPAVGLTIFSLVVGISLVRSLSASRGSALRAPRGSALGMRQLLLAVLMGAILVLPGIAAPRFGIDPRVALVAAPLTIVLLFVILVGVRIRVTAESRTVFPGTPEQLFQIATDIKLSLQVTGGPRKLVSQTGEPGQSGSSYVTEQPGLVLTTRVVSSDPPRKLVTILTGRLPAPIYPHIALLFPRDIFRTDVEMTYTPVAEGTLLEARTRQRMALSAWLLLPLQKRRVKAEAARANARIRDYLAASAANMSGVGN